MKSWTISGLCKPNCIEALFAMEINMKELSVDIEFVGNDQVHNSSTA